MDFGQFFKLKVIGQLRKVFGQDCVNASSTAGLTGITGHIIRSGNEADLVFRVDEDNIGLFVNCGVMRSDVMNQTFRIEDPLSILDVILAYAKEWAGVEQSGRFGMRAEQIELEQGTLTGVNPAEYNGLDEINNPANPYGDTDVEIKELV